MSTIQPTDTQHRKRVGTADGPAAIYGVRFTVAKIRSTPKHVPLPEGLEYRWGRVRVHMARIKTVGEPSLSC